MNDKIKFLITMFLFNKKYKYIRYGLSLNFLLENFYYVKIYNRNSVCERHQRLKIQNIPGEGWVKHIINT